MTPPTAQQAQRSGLAFLPAEVENARAHTVAVTDFVRLRLPSLNRAVRDDALRTREFIMSVRAVLDGIDTTAQNLDVETRPSLFSPLAMMAASAERHWQVNGGAPGDVYGHLPGLEDALVTLAGPDRIPYLTAYDLWLDDAESMLSFTGEEPHRYFRDSVRAQVRLHSVTNDVLREVVDGQYVVGTEHCSAVMSTAAVAMAQARRLYQQMTHGITPAEFNEFRGWLPMTTIKGVSYPGPNAAWLHEMVRTDILFGTASKEYVEQNVLGVIDRFSVEGRRLLDEDLRLSVTTLDVFAAALGFADARSLAEAPDTNVVEAVRGASGTMRSTLDSLVELGTAVIGASAAHWGQIQRCLVRPSFTAEELARMAVKPTAGTGGHAHDETWLIHMMRKTSPAVAKIAAAAKAGA